VSADTICIEKSRPGSLNSQRKWNKQPAIFHADMKDPRRKKDYRIKPFRLHHRKV